MEYYSFLFRVSKWKTQYACGRFPSPYGVLFILIIPSSPIKWFLFLKFPSPYGVLFILIFESGTLDKVDMMNNFRLLMEYYSFLSYGQKNLLLQYIFRVLSCDIFIFEIFLSISVKSILNSLFFEYRLTNIFL